MSMQWGADAYVRYKRENERQARREEEKVPLFLTRLIVGIVVVYLVILFGGPALRAKLAAQRTVDASLAAVKR